MPRVVFRGFLRRAKRPSLGRPDTGLPEEGEDQTPDWGLEEGELPEVGVPEFPGLPLPTPPPGVWPPPTPGHPVQPLPPEEEGPGVWPPVGSIWPPVNPPGWKPSKPPGTPGQPLPTKKLWVLAIIPGIGVKYICVDLNAIVWPPDMPSVPQPK